MYTYWITKSDILRAKILSFEEVHLFQFQAQFISVSVHHPHYPTTFISTSKNKSKTHGQSTRLCTYFYHPQGNVSRFIWLIANNSKNNVWEHLVCSYHTVLPHCEQHEKQMGWNKDIMELSYRRNSFNAYIIIIKLIGLTKDWIVFDYWGLMAN